MSKKPKKWSHSVGERGARVRVYERHRGGPIQISIPQGDGTYRRESLGHTDRRRAEAEALAEANKLAAGHGGDVTLAVLFALYLERVSPGKSATSRKADRRRAEMWLRVLGHDTDAHEIPTEAYRSFIRDRSSGAIDPRGRAVAPAERQTVRDRTVGADCKWLIGVLRWGVNEHTGAGYLLRENVLRGMSVPVEKNPRRPVASRDRFEAIRAVADESDPLLAVFDLAMSTGRRLSAILALRADDLQLERGPHGFIRWRADADKTGRETVVPIDAEARAAVDRTLARRRVIGSGLLFPSAQDATKPVSRYEADRWLRRMEELAGVEPQEGSLWHAYRRGWATARKHYADADVAKLGGWSKADTLRSVYQQADEKSLLEIVEARPELREVRAHERAHGNA